MRLGTPLTFCRRQGGRGERRGQTLGSVSGWDRRIPKTRLVCVLMRLLLCGACSDSVFRDIDPSLSYPRRHDAYPARNPPPPSAAQPASRPTSSHSEIQAPHHEDTLAKYYPRANYDAAPKRYDMPPRQNAVPRSRSRPAPVIQPNPYPRFSPSPPAPDLYARRTPDTDDHRDPEGAHAAHVLCSIIKS